MSDGFDLFSFLADKHSFRLWTESVGEASSNNILKKLIVRVLENELTEKQREYLLLYIVEKKSMQEIAEMYSVNKSTVQRGICGAKKKIMNSLRYADPRFFDVQTLQKNKRVITKTRIKLKPCPICGSEAEFVQVFETKLHGGFVRCTKCFYEERCYTSRKYAVKKWNRRVDNEC